MKDRREILFESLLILLSTIFSLVCGSILAMLILLSVYIGPNFLLGLSATKYQSLIENHSFLSWLTILGEGLALLFIWLFNHFLFKVKVFFLNKKFFRALAIGSPVIIFIGINLYVYLSKKSAISFFDFFTAASVALLVGIFEEYAARGMIIGKLEESTAKNFSFFVTVIISAIFFSALHLINLFSASLEITSVQIIYTSALGILFGLVYLVTKNLTVTIISHTLIDFIAFMADPKAIFGLGHPTVNLIDFVFNLTILIIFFAYAKLFLKKINLKKLQKNWN
ncbi:CPBP family intramembrane glutamic endopeptidase [Oenococcus oeni]|nr:CPBP family intramembrane glutamic endopeptidase [Oenococcus oeni]OIK68260.1 immunity protein [Oenococcus oeni]OIL14805.1 immunity protein [Oenococcus oeni]OIL29147.1 immunity protein [Oenococcus oeni]OIL81453.1 immunity protein [Oenococcus oeni]OIM45961.1 immunity protein [Oenococcus oeni]